MFERQKPFSAFSGFGIAAAIGLCCGWGCGHNGPNRVVVTGQVTLKSKPVEDGQIRFVPQGDDAGPVAIAPIRGGHYRYDLKGGVPLGNHRVEILAWDPKVPPPRGPGVPPRPQWAPDEFNKRSKLVVEIGAASGEVIRDFHL